MFNCVLLPAEDTRPTCRLCRPYISLYARLSKTIICTDYFL